MDTANGTALGVQRTETDALCRTAVPVDLGGRLFLIKPQPKRQSAHFRKAVADVLGGLKSVTVLADLFAKVTSRAKAYDLTALPVQEALAFVEWFLREGGDQALDLVYAYDPAIEQEHEWIEDHATDEEVIQAIAVIFDLVFRPLVRALPQALGLGSAADSIGPSTLGNSTAAPKPKDS